MRRFLPYLAPLIIGMGGGLWIGSNLFRKKEGTPPSQESQTLLIERLAALGKMELLRYQVRDVVRKEWSYAVPFTSSRLLMVVAGEAMVCMDFDQVHVVSLDWERRFLRLSLPAPVLCQVKVDPRQSQVYSADFSVIEWWRGGEAERVREVLAAAQETLRVRLERDFPRSAAQAQAEKLLRRLCEEMGWKQIEFTYERGPKG